MADLELDLLGDPIPEGHGRRGRPPHMVSDEKRRLVIQLLAFGKTQDEIAAALGITAPTLRKNYFRQLKVKDDARARVEAKLLGKLMDLAEDGKVSAIREIFSRLESSDRAKLAEAIANRGKSVPAASQKALGKKEKRKQAAETYDGKYAPPQAPQLIN
ncbi:hypothetical protein PsAD2_04635 [Pseudovibrio axinellae]|uniref:Uncharacterized protein n=1 Tax=Pseudovibrio axinellae TaxID=989403 RepID=A0A165SW40_9HYPH|nr:hypothetical protein [Pseudovibrio axinellae]KZL04552.1 hypothetical protein PsAD2_04635 [Pseudovibrio axinellae]SEQ73353.1 hypothetical protein SAMN05421798_10473 [Pseudovibrio axinellae]